MESLKSVSSATFRRPSKKETDTRKMTRPAVPGSGHHLAPVSRQACTTANLRIVNQTLIVIPTPAVVPSLSVPPTNCQPALPIKECAPANRLHKRVLKSHDESYLQYRHRASRWMMGLGIEGLGGCKCKIRHVW